jgi:antirestriction protein ArdC
MMNISAQSRLHHQIVDGAGTESSQYSKHGQCVSASQKPDATRVAGFYAWNQLGRKVKKGEHGIRILAPMIEVRRKKDEEAEKDIRTQNQAVLVGFRAAYVFDVSQTEGNSLPEFSERVSGNAGEYRSRLVNFVIGQGIELEFKESIAPALGMSYGGKIALLPGQSSAEEFSTLVHELAHLCCAHRYVA